MKKITILIIIVILLTGCAHNQITAKEYTKKEKECWEEYGNTNSTLNYKQYKETCKSLEPNNKEF